jgi:hypothetical protein
MEAQAIPGQRPFAWRRALVLAAVVLALALLGVLIGGFVWLKTYSPLAEGNFYTAMPPEGHLVEPVPGSGGIEVFYIRERRSGIYHVKVSLLNSGRFGVDVLGPAKPRADQAPVFVPVAMRATRYSADGPVPPPAYAGPLGHGRVLHLKPGEQRLVEVTYRLGIQCIGGQPDHYWVQPRPIGGDPGAGVIASRANGLRTRVRYARVFEHTQSVPIPFAFALACAHGTEATHH